jgi:hypothetical protein
MFIVVIVVFIEFWVIVWICVCYMDIKFLCVVFEVVVGVRVRRQRE